MSAQSSAPRLRPLGVGEILDVGIKVYTRNWLTLWKIVIFVVLPAQILVNAVEASATSPVELSQPGFGNQRTLILDHHELKIFVLAFGIAFLISIVSGELAKAGCFRAIASAYLGEEAHWGSSLRYALRRLPALIVLSLAAGLLTGIGMVFCFIPGIYLLGAFYVAVPVLLVEGAGPFKALGRSRRLVSGRWWGTFGVFLVGFVLVGLITAVLTNVVVGIAFAHPAPGTASGFILNTLAATIASVLTTPVAASFATVLYIDLRVRKEGFDLLLLAQGIGAAPEPGMETPPPDFLPQAPAWTGDKPPYWPPPPGWTPSPPPVSGTPEPAAKPDVPPYWPPPPGWKPSPPPDLFDQPPAADEPDVPPFWPPPPGWKPKQQ